MDLCQYLKENTTKFEKYVPFYNFFYPVINHNLDALLTEIKRLDMVEDLDLFIENSIKHILDSLFEIAYRVIVLEVNMARMDGKLQGELPVDRITYFANNLLKNPVFISNLYDEYSTLIQVLNLTVENYFHFMIEILRNTKSELRSIENKLNNGESLGKITKIETGAGDGHKKGKAVSILHFSSNKKIVYKPRSLELESGFNLLLDWLNSKNIDHVLDFKKSKVHTTGEFGWMEYIENKECDDLHQIRRFYNRSGQYLCLLYVLNSIDFHYENLIASGEYPMLIDMESIFHAVVKTEKKEVNSGYIKARHLIQSSVNTISLLPTMISKKSGNREVNFDLGGLSVNEEQTIPIKSLFIEGIESDFIRIIRKDSTISPKSNNPVMEGKIVSSEEYVAELKYGFQYLYMWIMTNKREFEERTEQIFGHMKSRLIVKATAFYGQLLKIAAHPDFMRENYDRKLILHRVGVSSTEKQRWITRSEYEDLYNQDIPYFMTYINDTKITNSRNDVYDGLLEETSLETMKKKLAELSHDDLNRQLDFIEMSYFNKRTEKSDLTHIQFGSHVNKLTPDRWIKVAEEIGEHILENSIEGVNDFHKRDRFWISTSLQGFEEDIWKPDVLGFDIYNGNSGIALFLGFLGKILSRNDFKEAAFQAMAMPKSIIVTLEKDLPYPIGAFTGLSGIFYTLKKLADLYSDDTSIQFINSHVHSLLDILKKDDIHDVIGGAAGTLGVAVSLYDTGHIGLRESAQKLAKTSYDQIVKSCISKDGMIFWPSAGAKAYSGFSHGNSGFIPYMYRLYTITRNVEILEYIEQALKFERKLFSKPDSNWYTTDKKEKVSHGWCHGAPGILLSKAMLKDHGYRDSEIDKEMEIAINTTSLKGIGNSPTYCHGDLGNLAILEYISKLTGNIKLQNLCIHTYQELFERILSKEWNQKNLKCGWSLSLMIGITGFGYSMIKHYSSELVPEFLWLE